MKMDIVNDVTAMAAAAQARAREVLEESGIVGILERAGCRVNLIGSLKMGLLASHRDIDLHVYSTGITERSSFEMMSAIAEIGKVTEIKCINGLRTDERCVAWHVTYRAAEDENWQFDIIHIESGTRYDGFFERMADRICEVMTADQRDTILRLKFEAPADSGYHGVEYYEAVIADGVNDIEGLKKWVDSHRLKPPYYWIP